MLRGIYLVSAVLAAANAAWMLLVPESWFNTVPGVVDTGPFNIHLVRDLGIVFGVTSVGFLWSSQNLSRCYPVHLGITLFYVGHALLHVADMSTGRLPAEHWMMDFPGVFLPALILGGLSWPAVWRRVNPQDRGVS